jgi:hypothetical protein
MKNKNKKLILEVIFIVILVALPTVYIDNYNFTTFKSLDLNINNLDFKPSSNNLNTSVTNNRITISYNNNQSASWTSINSEKIPVKPGWQILLSVKGEYLNTQQTTFRIIGCSNLHTQSVLAYVFILDGNSSWHYYNGRVKIPSNIQYIILQVEVGWVIINNHSEIISLEDMSLYRIV